MGRLWLYMLMAKKAIDSEDNALSRLRKKWLALALGQFLLICFGFLILRIWWEPQFSSLWAGMAGLFSLVFLGQLRSELKLNTRPGDNKILPHFGAGNILTIWRGFVIALLIGFLITPWPTGWLAWLPGLLYSIAALADLFDGYLARRFDHATLLGERLDLSLDGLGVLIASILLVKYGQVPVWYLLVGMARYLYIGGIWLRQKSGKKVYDLRESPTRRPFAGAQMGFIAVVLFPVFSPPGTYLAAAFFAIPFLIGFIADWLVVSGMENLVIMNIFPLGSYLKSDPKIERFFQSWIEKVLKDWLPLFVRVVLVFMLLVWIERSLMGLFPLQSNSSINIPLASSLPGIWLVGLFVFTSTGIVLIALGAAGRFAAILVLFGVGIYTRFFGLTPIEVLLVTGSALLFYLGSGPYSIWNPERFLISGRLGEV